MLESRYANSVEEPRNSNPHNDARNDARNDGRMHINTTTLRPRPVESSEDVDNMNSIEL